MADSVYKVIELVGTSTDSLGAGGRRLRWRWPSSRCATCASPRCPSSTWCIEDGKVTAYRAKVKVSFKYEGGA